MEAEWYYAEDGKCVGPVSKEEILGWIVTAKDPEHLVWTAGLSEWTEARDLPQFSESLRGEAHFRGRGVKTMLAGHADLAERARHELISYAAVSGYLLVWFSAVMFYKATVLHSVGVEFAPFGIAVVKALILGKFILLLEAFKVGEGRRDGGVLAVQILKKALLFTLLLFVLTVLEEVVVGLFHGRAAREALSAIAGGSVPQAVATVVLMFLVLLPYFAYRQVALMLGELPELLFTRRTPAKEE
jgi:hypothetical protein